MNAVALFNGGQLNAVEIKGRTGKVLGARVMYSGQALTAKELKESLKAADPALKGQKLADKVNEVLRGESDARWVLHEAALSAMRSNGFVPDFTDAKRASAITRYSKPGDKPQKTEAEVEKEQAETLVALGFAADVDQALVMVKERKEAAKKEQKPITV